MLQTPTKNPNNVVSRNIRNMHPRRASVLGGGGWGSIWSHMGENFQAVINMKATYTQYLEFILDGTIFSAFFFGIFFLSLELSAGSSMTGAMDCCMCGAIGGALFGLAVTMANVAAEHIATLFRL